MKCYGLHGGNFELCEDDICGVLVVFVNPALENATFGEVIMIDSPPGVFLAIMDSNCVHDQDQVSLSLADGCDLALETPSS
jgi:hypothetical protein